MQKPRKDIIVIIIIFQQAQAKAADAIASVLDFNKHKEDKKDENRERA